MGVTQTSVADMLAWRPPVRHSEGDVRWARIRDNLTCMGGGMRATLIITPPSILQAGEVPNLKGESTRGDSGEPIVKAPVRRSAGSRPKESRGLRVSPKAGRDRCPSSSSRVEGGSSCSVFLFHSAPCTRPAHTGASKPVYSVY